MDSLRKVAEQKKNGAQAKLMGGGGGTLQQMTITHPVRSISKMMYSLVCCCTVGEELPCVREVGNHSDPLAIAVMKSRANIGHVTCGLELFVNRF